MPFEANRKFRAPGAGTRINQIELDNDSEVKQEQQRVHESPVPLPNPKKSPKFHNKIIKTKLPDTDNLIQLTKPVAEKLDIEENPLLKAKADTSRLREMLAMINQSNTQPLVQPIDDIPSSLSESLESDEEEEQSPRQRPSKTYNKLKKSQKRTIRTETPSFYQENKETSLLPAEFYTENDLDYNSSTFSSSMNQFFRFMRSSKLYFSHFKSRIFNRESKVEEKVYFYEGQYISEKFILSSDRNRMKNSEKKPIFLFFRRRSK